MIQFIIIYNIFSPSYPRYHTVLFATVDGGSFIKSLQLQLTTAARLRGFHSNVTGHDHAYIIKIIIFLQKIDPGRKRRDVPANNTINAFDDNADSMTLVGRVHVYSPDDLLTDNFNHTDFLDSFQTFTTGNIIIDYILLTNL